jgi:hypothetical protein
MEHTQVEQHEARSHSELRVTDGCGLATVSVTITDDDRGERTNTTTMTTDELKVLEEMPARVLLKVVSGQSPLESEIATALRTLMQEMRTDAENDTSRRNSEFIRRAARGLAGLRTAHPKIHLSITCDGDVLQEQSRPLESLHEAVLFIQGVAGSHWVEQVRIDPDGTFFRVAVIGPREAAVTTEVDADDAEMLRGLVIDLTQRAGLTLEWFPDPQFDEGLLACCRFNELLERYT